MIRLACAGFAALALAGSAVAFAPTDPLVDKQWYLVQDRPFELWNEKPALPAVRVAVIDSGIDLGHPEFQGRIALARSFVGGSVADTEGHGTFSAGVIAAAVDNAQGIAGLAFPARLVVAKVVRADGTIDPGDEARAIRWAVDNGARVINLSLGALRDPGDPARDSYSPLEERAIEYAYGHGAVVVAAVGNGDSAPSEPWPFASYPAALPHVIGVAALARDGSVPDFSNRDPVYVDIAAPGVDIYSTLPRALTAARPACANQGYSDCGPFEYRDPQGTSFAAPQVAAAAALLLAVRPGLAPGQVTTLLERSAADVNAATGCRRCPLQRDSFSGWGRLDITAALRALNGPLPPRDGYEPNDDAGDGAYPLFGAVRQIDASIDYWDDPRDVYRVKLASGMTLTAVLKGLPDIQTSLDLFLPGTQSIVGSQERLAGFRVAKTVGTGPVERLVYTAAKGGWYYLEVSLGTPGSGGYRLSIAKR